MPLHVGGNQLFYVESTALYGHVTWHNKFRIHPQTYPDSRFLVTGLSLCRGSSSPLIRSLICLTSPILNLLGWHRPSRHSNTTCLVSLSFLGSVSPLSVLCACFLFHVFSPSRFVLTQSANSFVVYWELYNARLFGMALFVCIARCSATTPKYI